MICPNCHKKAGQLSMHLDVGKCPLCAKKGVFTKEDILRARKLNKEG
jgi:hypothetical protein